MVKTSISKGMIGVLLIGFVIPYAYATEGVSVDKFERILTTSSEAKAIPDWVQTTMGFYLEKQISEREILDAFNYLFENNIMHLSQEAAQEVQDMRNKILELEKELEETKAAIAIPNLLDARKGANESAAISTLRVAVIDVPSVSGDDFQIFVASEEGTDINSLIQQVLRESYLETNKDLQFYADKVRHYNDLKEAIRNEISEMRSTSSTTNPDILNPDILNPDILNPDILNSNSKASELIGDLIDTGVATESDWENVIEHLAVMHGYDTTDSVADDLQGIVVLCSTAIDKEISELQGEITAIQELSEMHANKDFDATSGYSNDDGSDDPNLYDFQQWVTKKTSSINTKIQSLQIGLMVLEEKLVTVGDDAQLANIDLQNALQKQQQTLQTMSNVSKMLHDTAMAVIRKIG